MILGLALAAGAAPAPTCSSSLRIEPLVRVGDAVAGASVVAVGPFDLGRDGHWTAVAYLDDPLLPEVLLRDGRVIARWGDVTAVPGVQVGSFSAPRIDDRGRVSWAGVVEPFPLHLSGLFLGGKLVLVDGDPGQAPALPAGLQFRFFQAVHIGAGRAVVACDLDGALPPGQTFHQALLRLTPTPGGPPSQAVVVQTGDVLPGTSGPVALLADAPGELDVNGAGEVLFLTATADGVLWVFRDDVPIARSGDPIAPTGDVLDQVLALATNDAGDWALAARLGRADGTVFEAVVRNGSVVASEGDAVAGVPGATLASAGGRVALTARGQVLWHGRWDDPDPTRDEAVFVDRRPLIREGVSTVHGELLTALGPAAVDEAGARLLFAGGLGPGGAESDALLLAELP